MMRQINPSFVGKKISNLSSTATVLASLAGDSGVE